MFLKNRHVVFIIGLCFTFVINSQSAYGKNAPSICIEQAIDSGSKDDCSDSLAIEKIIVNAIEIGGPIYNAGFHIGCYRVYEWAAYKILHVYGDNCKRAESILKTAIEKSHGDYSDTEKAWLMRMAFDKILGVPTKTENSEKASPKSNGVLNG